MSYNNFRTDQSENIKDILNKLDYYHENFNEFASARRLNQLSIVLQGITTLFYFLLLQRFDFGHYESFFIAMAFIQVLNLLADFFFYNRNNTSGPHYNNVTRKISYITLTKGLLKILLGSPISGLSEILMWKTLHDQWKAIKRGNIHGELFYSILTSSLLIYYLLLLFFTFIPLKLTSVMFYIAILLLYSICGEIYVLTIQEDKDFREISQFNFTDFTYVNFYLIILATVRLTALWLYPIWVDFFPVLLGIFGIFDFLGKNDYDLMIGSGSLLSIRVVFALSGIVFSLFYLGLNKIMHFLVYIYVAGRIVIPAFHTSPILLSTFFLLLGAITSGYLFISYFINDASVYRYENNREALAVKFKSPLGEIKKVKEYFNYVNDDINKLKDSMEHERQSIEQRIREEVDKHASEWYNSGVKAGQSNLNFNHNEQKDALEIFFSQIPVEIRTSFLKNYHNFLQKTYNEEPKRNTSKWINSEIEYTNEMLKNQKGKKP